MVNDHFIDAFTLVLPFCLSISCVKMHSASKVEHIVDSY